jgi:hypothetical protein
MPIIEHIRYQTLLQHDQRLARAATAIAHLNLSVGAFASLCARLKRQLAEHVGYDAFDLFAADEAGVAHGLPLPQVLCDDGSDERDELITYSPPINGAP